MSSKYNKLVRDKIPSIIKDSGRRCNVERLNEKEYKSRLKEKLEEEVQEYLDATDQGESLGELADILEVIHALAETHGTSIREVERIRLQKAEERGGFNERILLINTDTFTEDYKEVKVGELVQSTMRNLASSNKLSADKIQFLCDYKYSKRTFDINYPFLIKLQPEIPIDEQGIFNGYNRYWKKPILINGERYLMCSQWYDRNKPKFMNWVQEQN
ncbi:nucleoside triphosphate pyrophosphohydrolase [Litchfieldia alkalitelluris]|uniref:nucleoside triphosphate pyrophosphohydrolase n=1 Tax=Litchfieldia alkalitelluris TaxID=304268 RepID=UPI002E26AEA3